MKHEALPDMLLKRIIIAPLFLLVFFTECFSQQRVTPTQMPVQTDRRTALVIGNAAYRDSPLKNPINDARDIAQTLTALGFEVNYKENVTQNDMKRAIRAFGEKLRGGGVGLFYYAGHGLQVNGENYLIPVDAVINNAEEVEYEAINAGFVLAQMEAAQNDINIVILDACRNNPFTRNWRSISRGLALMNAPGGTLIAYSTAPGSVANDGNQRNGIYTQELIKNIQVPNLDIEKVLKHVRVSVRSLTAGQQIPWESSSLTRDFYFVSANGEVPDNQPITSPKYEPVAGSADYYERRGSSFQRDEKYVEAEAEYRKGLRIDPNHKMLRILLGVVLTYQRKYQEAIDEYRKVLATDPENWNAASNLAMIYADYGVGDADEALKLAKINAKNYSKNSFFEGELGWVYYRMEMYTEAIEHLQKSASRTYQSSIAHFRLGMAFARTGENAKAQIELEEALRKNELVPEQVEEARYQLKLLDAERNAPTTDLSAPSSGIQGSGNNSGTTQVFRKILKGVMWLDRQTSYDGEVGYLEFLEGGSIRARTPKHAEAGIMANTRWYLSVNTIYVIEYADDAMKKIFTEYKGVVKTDRIEGTRKSGTLTTPWLLTKFNR